MSATARQDLSAEIEQSRKDIAELQARVNKLTARRRERENMVKKVQDSAAGKLPDAPLGEGRDNKNIERV